MTIPTLVANYQKQVTITQVHKFYSMFSQAIMQSESDNGDKRNWDYGTAWDAASSILFFSKYLSPYLKISKDYGNSAQGCSANPFKTLDGADYSWNADKWHYAMLADGSCVSENISPSLAVIGYDINGPKLPNKAGKDIFKFDIYPNLSFMPSYSDQTREQLTASGGHCSTDSSGDGNGCAALIMDDNWEIKNDYPWK